MNNTILILAARAVSGFGSVLSGASIPLYLSASGRTEEISINALFYSMGIVCTSKFIVPRIAYLDGKTVMQLSAGIGAIFFLTLGAGVGLSAIHTLPSAAILTATLISSVLMALDSNIAGAILGSTDQNGHLVNIEAWIFTVARTIGPGIAAVLLATTGPSPTTIFLMDGTTFILAGIIITLVSISPTTTKSIPNHKNMSFISVIKNHQSSFTILAVIAACAATYNVGIIAHLTLIGMPMSNIAIFSTSQNIAMVTMGAILAKYPHIAMPGRFLAVTVVGAAMIVFSISTDFLTLCIATAVMAFGMVTIIQGLRTKLATSTRSETEKRFDLSVMTSINSGTSILAGAVIASISLWTGWQAIFATAAIVSFGLALSLGLNTISQKSIWKFRSNCKCPLSKELLLRPHLDGTERTYQKPRDMGAGGFRRTS